MKLCSDVVENAQLAVRPEEDLPTTIHFEAKMEVLQQQLQGMVDGAILVEDEETTEQEQPSLQELEAEEENNDDGSHSLG